MAVVDWLLGPRCPRCSVRRKGPVHKDGGSGWLCQSCHDKDEEAKRQQSPAYQLESVVPTLLAAAQSAAETSATERLEHLCARFDAEWKGRSRSLDWRTKAKTEALLLPALSSDDRRLQKLAVKLLVVVGFVPAVPKLIPLLAHESLVDDAWTAMAEIRRYFDGGWGTCPRCGSTNTQEGNATGWRCKNCDLEYHPRGSRDPLAFIVTGGFHGSPWRRKDMADLLDEVLALRTEGGAAPISIDRTRALTQRAEAIAAMRVEILNKLTN